MPKVVQQTVIAVGVLIAVFGLAMMPLVIQNGGDGGTLHFDWSQGFRGILDYFAGIGTNESFQFFVGKNERSFWEWIGGYFTSSFQYVAGGAVIGIAAGILIGIYLAYSRAEWLKRVMDFTGVLPDFAIILILQFIIVFIAQKSGVVVFRVASLSSDEQAIVLPLIAMAIVPANYMIRTVAAQMKLTLSEDYILYAKARGMGKTYTMFFHALPNVLPFIKADLHKLLGMLMGNLFVVEYFFNLRGVTRLLFSNAFADDGYQLDLVVNGLLTLLALYAALYGLLRFCLFCLEKVFVR